MGVHQLDRQLDKPAFSFQETRKWPVSYGGICDSELGYVAWTSAPEVQVLSEGEGKAEQIEQE